MSTKHTTCYLCFGEGWVRSSAMRGGSKQVCRICKGWGRIPQTSAPAQTRRQRRRSTQTPRQRRRSTQTAAEFYGKGFIPDWHDRTWQDGPPPAFLATQQQMEAQTHDYQGLTPSRG